MLQLYRTDDVKTWLLISLLFLGALLPAPLLGQAHTTITLSPYARISLLTCSPGSEIYSYFGHCAIRVYDPVANYDRVFNYGTFSFNQPNFYLKFIRGRLLYSLSVNSFNNFVAEYESDNRWVIEQVLQLSEKDRQIFFDRLMVNALPQNRSYLYDFFFDNCATRPRDLLEQSFPNRLFFPDSLTPANPSFRQLIDPYIVKNAWVDFGIDLILGLPTDRKASAREYMFLPDYLMNAFANAQIADSTGNKIALVQQTNQIVETTPQISKTPFFTPTLALCIILVIGIIITFFQLKNKNINPWFDFVLFSICGLMGLLFLFLWFGTDHKVLVRNFNIIWAFPLHIIASALLLAERTPSWVGVYFGIFALIGTLLLLTWFWLPQQLPNALLFLVTLLTLRAALLFKLYQASG